MEDMINVKKVKVHDQFLQRAIRSIEEQMGNPQYGVMQLADELCVSRSLLHKKMISSVGQSAGSFINATRMKKAALLLLEENQKVSQVAFESAGLAGRRSASRRRHSGRHRGGSQAPSGPSRH